MGKKLTAGDKIAPLSLQTIQRSPLVLPHPRMRLTHLQFRRFAGCPICNLHLRTFAKSADAIRAAGIHEVVFFHSTVEQMLPYQGDLPFDVIADPDKKLYLQFGVETSLRSIVDPRAWKGFFRGIFAAHPSDSFAGDENGHLGLPADLLIDASGTVIASKYGKHADDQWSVAELLQHAAR